MSNTLTPTQATCQQCQKPVKGRSDKKFCNDYCRNAFNNKIKSSQTNIIRNTNNALIRNRKILREILPESCNMTKVKREKLLQCGYVFKYNTSFHKNKKGSVYSFCYEFGLMILNEEWCLVFLNEINNND